MRENEKMRNASGQKVENEGSEKNSEQEHKQQTFLRSQRHFSLKKMYLGRSALQQQRQRNVQKVCCEKLLLFVN